VPQNEKKPWLTFDCYDTLVRYTESKSSAFTEIIISKGADQKIVGEGWSIFESSERKLQAGSFLPLHQILQRSLRTAMEGIGLNCIQDDEVKMLEAVKKAPPFPDVNSTLIDLKRDYRLAILSNSEPDIIGFNIASIGVTFDAVVLAAEAKCYKPASGMFKELIKRIDEVPGNITHIAQSFYHDMRTAKDLGFGRRLWINRYNKKGDAAYKPDAELPDLSEVKSTLEQLRELD